MNILTTLFNTSTTDYVLFSILILMNLPIIIVAGACLFPSARPLCKVAFYMMLQAFFVFRNSPNKLVAFMHRMPGMILMTILVCSVLFYFKMHLTLTLFAFFSLIGMNITIWALIKYSDKDMDKLLGSV
jgi:hypothetical protein